MDMTKSIEPKSDQMNAEDLLSGPRTFTITRVDVRLGSDDQPVSVFLAEFPQGRPFKPSKTVRKLMVLAWGAESDAYIGERMTLYCDPTVKWAGKEIGGVRVSHMSGLKRKISVPLSVTRGTRALYVVEALKDDAPPAKVPGPLDQLVWAMNAAGVDQNPGVRLAYCRRIVQRELKTAADLTAAELADVIAALTAEPSDVDLEPTAAERAAPSPERDPAEPSDEEWARMQGGGPDA